MLDTKRMNRLKEKIHNQIGGLKGTSRSAKVKKNILGSFGVKGISIIISLVLVPLTIGYVSSELYGIWLTLVTVISWVHLFDFGFGHGARNKIAESVSLGNWEKARQYVSTSYFYFTLLFVPIAAILFFVCKYVNWISLLNVDAKYQELIIQVMRIVIVFFCISFIVNIQNTVLRALQLNALGSAFSAIGQVLVLIVTYILTITTEPSLVYLAFAISGCPILVNLVCTFWLFGHKYKQLRPSIKYIDTSLVKDVLNLGLKFFVIQIAGLVLYQTMNIIISHVAGPEAVTEYNVVYKYLSIPMMASSMMVDPFWSAFTEAYSIKDYGWMQRSYSKLLRFFILALLLVVLLALVYPIAFKLWLGDKVIIHTTMILIVSAYVVVMIWQNIHSALINGMGRITLSVICSFAIAIINIPLSLYLGGSMGAQGVVLSVGGLNLTVAGLYYIQVRKLIYNRANGIWGK